ncbi:lactose/L-arabinose transport system substrate-binding protein [Caldalkalibacillus uzonensis]|uniref:Lactose/L-arabinose transport system substrate-binding protein n=1 Tax=Caldalkalibacillus uzonensis TaxID=353224 RepID=A0ABU0CUE1_9BACI|nr:extracellular solute-binding protein [Caldalkalibacillus uzonensis]MDQ0338642.1 lactose/L-arabinose transport system substrate-binding protein [Caldalkalibacillus uzonensis]
MPKKYLYVSLIAVFVISLLSACGGNQTHQQEPEQASNGTEGDGVSGEITVAGWNLAADAMVETAEKFMEKYPDANIKVEYVTSDYDSIIPPLTAGRGAPDVIQIQQRDFPNFLEVFPNQFVDITDRLDGRENEFAEVAMNLAQQDGRVYALPWDLGPAAVYYRKDFFENAGIDAESITTWDKFIEAGKKIQEANEGVKMLALGYSSNDVAELYRILMNQLGAQYYDEEGNIQFVSEENIKAIEMYKKIVDEGIVMDAPTWDDRIRAFVNNQVAAVIYPVWYAGTIKTQAPDQEGLWGLMPLPAFEEGGPNQAHSGGSVLAISTQSENEELAWKFIEFALMTEEGQDIQMKYGLFPSWQPYYETEQFKVIDEYFGIALSDFFGQLSTDIPPLDYGAHFMDINNAIIDALGAVMLDNENIEDALRRAEQRAARDTGLNIAE